MSTHKDFQAPLMALLGWLALCAGQTAAQTTPEITGLESEPMGNSSLCWSGDTGVLFAIESAGTLEEWAHVISLAGPPGGTTTNHWTTQLATGAFFRVAVGGGPAPTGGVVVTYVPVEGIGDMAVRIATPRSPRYADGAPVVLEIGTFLTTTIGFYNSADFTGIGLINLSYLWPGSFDPMGISSEGMNDYGDTNSIRALSRIIRFALGQIPDRDGRHLHDLCAIPPVYSNVGLYAFSHPGIAAVNVLADHGLLFSNRLAWLVGRENPTHDILTAVEVGHFEGPTKVLNAAYVYARDYASTNINISHESVWWATNYAGNSTPFFDFNTNRIPEPGIDYILGTRVPRINNKRFYSRAMLHHLLANGALAPGDWPADLATPAEADALWPYRNSVDRYPELSGTCSNLHVLLLFALDDHVQPATDKPHVHQAYEGFRMGAHLWTRLNPDRAYMYWSRAALGAQSPDNPANTAPAAPGWANMDGWSYTNRALPGAELYAAMAAVAEMADRAYHCNWSNDLSGVLVTNMPPP